MPNMEHPINFSISNIRFQYNWLFAANGWVFEPIWWDQKRLHAMANKDRATNPPPEKQGGEGWLLPLYP